VLVVPWSIEATKSANCFPPAIVSNHGPREKQPVTDR
jgi:hypothetical protein